MDYSTFRTKREGFLDHQRHAEEPMPHHQPKPRVLPVTTMAFMEASHAANKKTRKSHMGYLLLINLAPIIWYSKRQKTVKTNQLLLEFIALKACTKAIISLQGACHKFYMWQQERCKKFVQGRIGSKQEAQLIGVSLCLLGDDFGNHYSGMDCRQWEYCTHIRQASIIDSTGLSICKLVLLEGPCWIMFGIQPSFEGTELI